jgi:hypothetical protein
MAGYRGNFTFEYGIWEGMSVADNEEIVEDFCKNGDERSGSVTMNVCLL